MITAKVNSEMSSLSTVDPEELFDGVLVVTVPHMDDAVLSCGGTIAKLPDKERIHVIYATDGRGSPAPVLPWRDEVLPDVLGQDRVQEAREAMGYLGVPEQNIHFLSFPDSHLRKHLKPLGRALEKLIQQIEPDHVLTPFRYDCHSDHLALNSVVTASIQEGVYQAQLTEYFVYYRWRLLPSGDVRNYIRSQHLVQVKIEDVSLEKRTALERFRSQTTRYYDWQTRPNLTPNLLDDVSQTPEVFLQFDSSVPGSGVFSKSVIWILLAHKMEPFLKKKKDQTMALLRRSLF
jgi:LmbE family N-acetylglucosaminyl deacetylase